MSSYYDLRAGIPVPEYGVTIPWHVTQSELFELIPRDRFESCHHGPSVLRFSLFGYTAPYWFNFVSQPGYLTEVQLLHWKPNWRALKQGVRQSADALRDALGPPNRVDIPDSQQTWHFPSLRAENWIIKARRVGNRPPWGYRHMLIVEISPTAQPRRCSEVPPVTQAR